MKRWLLILCALGYAGLLIARPQEASAAVQEALNLCLTRVIPSLFPFLAVTALLLRLGMASWLQGIFAPIIRPLSGLPGICAAPLLAGLLGGYPAGASATAGLYRDGLITRQEAELLLGFGNNCGCAFLYAFVGVGMLQSPRAGLWLVVVHALSALLTGTVLCRLGKNRGCPSLPCFLPWYVFIPVSTPMSTIRLTPSTIHQTCTNPARMYPAKLITATIAAYCICVDT